MTFDDDFIQIAFDGGVRRFTCKSLGIEWPPPEVATFYGIPLQRRRYSQISDEDRENMTHVVRGAEYIVAQERET